MVTIGTSGPTNWVQTPNGRKLSLGTVAPVKFVVELAPNSRAARQALDSFLKDGEGLLSVDLEKMLAMLEPKRSRWATDAFIPSDLQQMEKSALDLAWVDLLLSRAEAHVRKLASTPSPRGVASLEQTIQHLCHPQQASFEGRLAAVEQAVVSMGRRPTPQKAEAFTRLVGQLRSPKFAVELAASVLFEVGETNERIDTLVKEGKRFNSLQAKAELAKVVNAVAGISTYDLTVPEVRDELVKTACRADDLHKLFFHKSGALRPGTATQLETALAKLLKKFRGVNVSLEFRTRGKRSEPYIVVTMPTRSWFEDVLAMDLDALGEFNSLIRSFGADYKLTGSTINIQ